MTDYFSPQMAERPALCQIASDLPGSGAALWLGDSRAASNPAMLRGHGIAAVLNCAVNLDVNLVDPDDSKVGAVPHGPGMIRYYKLGLIDGDGNPPEMMLAGYLQLRAIFAQVLPERPSYPRRERGDVLINCRGGRSRSVALAALFLHLELPATYPALADAIAHIRAIRGLHRDEWHQAPKQVLIDQARWAAERAHVIGLTR